MFQKCFPNQQILRVRGQKFKRFVGQTGQSILFDDKAYIIFYEDNDISTPNRTSGPRFISPRGRQWYTYYTILEDGNCYDHS